MYSTPGGMVPMRRPSRYSVSRHPPLWMTRIADAESKHAVQPPVHVPINAPDQVAYHMRQQFVEQHGRQMARSGGGGACSAAPLSPQEFFTEVFWYGIDFIAQNQGNAIAAGATVTAILNFDQASDFVWTKSSFDQSPGEPADRLLLRMFDEATNRSLQNIPMPVNAFCAGTAQRPAINPAMRVTPANSTIFFELTNAGPNEIDEAFLILWGYKILYPSRLNLTGGMQSC
jgi:hypothetical protein